MRGGVRSNIGKPRLSLISPWAAEGLARVLTFGAQKYAAHTHIDHIQCNAMFLSHFMALPEYRAFDDRWKRGGERTRRAKDTRRRKRAHRVRGRRSA